MQNLSPATFHYVRRLVTEPRIEWVPWHSALKPVIMSQENPFSYLVRLCLSSVGTKWHHTIFFPLRYASLLTSTLKFCDACKCHQVPSEKVFIYPQGSQLDSFCQNILKSPLSLTHLSHPAAYHTHCLLGFLPWEIVPLHTYWSRNHNSITS